MDWRAYLRIPNRLATGTIRCAAFALLVSITALDARAALTPESREVRECVARGIKYLETADPDTRLGALALQGMALVKHGAPPTHPVVVMTADTVTRNAEDETLTQDIYSLGLSIIYLATLDPDKYRPEIQSLLEILATAQKDHGGWGYHNQRTGDTSMTQYGVLALWEAEQVGIPVPLEMWERVANWLLRTQDPSGAFGYQGNDPGNYMLVPQTEVRHSMAAAGTGSLYICADRFGMVQLRASTEDVPSVLRPVNESGQSGIGLRTQNVDASRMAAARERGDRWLLNNYTVEPEQWVYYYLYAFERYQSFREASQKKNATESWNWYDDAARFLISKQEEDGRWHEKGGDIADTAFAVLFLLRSTRKSILRAKTYGAGTLVGVRGLTNGTADVRLRRGKFVPRPLDGPADELLAIMNDPKHKDYLRAVETIQELADGDDVDVLAAQSRRLVELAEEASPEARAAAVKALARTRNLDHVPKLIKALKDPDLEVFLEARDGLRFISRKLRGFGLTAESSDAEVEAAAEQWKSWYRSIRPDSPLLID